MNLKEKMRSHCHATTRKPITCPQVHKGSGPAEPPNGKPKYAKLCASVPLVFHLNF